MSGNKRWPVDVIAKARLMRRQGATFGEIRKEMVVAKSTLHEWVKDIPLKDHIAYTNPREWLRQIRLLSAKAKRKQKEQRITDLVQRVQIEVDGVKISIDIAKAMLSMLYWGEGSKGWRVLCFANTDPKLIVLFVSLLRYCYSLDESKFRLRLHLHWYHKARLVKKYWSELLDIPESKIGKIFWKKRSKEKVFRKNFGGICFVKYNSVYLREEIMQFGALLGDRFINKRP